MTVTEPVSYGVVHRAPVGYACVVPCCGVEVLELPRTDSTTLGETVTCPGTGRDTCDDCPECRKEANWNPCCASCHCATSTMRCSDCRAAPAPQQQP